MMMMMMMIPGIFTYGTNTYRYSFRRYFGCIPLPLSSSSLPSSSYFDFPHLLHCIGGSWDRRCWAILDYEEPTTCSKISQFALIVTFIIFFIFIITLIIQIIFIIILMFVLHSLWLKNKMIPGQRKPRCTQIKTYSWDNAQVHIFHISLANSDWFRNQNPDNIGTMEGFVPFLHSPFQFKCCFSFTPRIFSFLRSY